MILFVVSFIAGILTVLAPCILPLLPVVLGGAVADAGNRRRPLIIIGSLSVSVLIFTLLLKGSTALISVSPSFWSYVSAIILGIFGLTLLFPETWARIILKIPGHNKADSWLSKNSLGKSSVGTDILIGAALGPVFTTCSPTFFVILATVLPQSLAMGIIDLLAYVVGLALALLLISYIGQKLVNHLEWAADPKGWFRKILGMLFIILAILIAFGWDKKIETGILNSGFFDVTTIEQSFHQYLEGDRGLPAPSGSESNPANATGTTTTVPGAPEERDLGRYVEIVRPAGFVNSNPFKLADLIGNKVILVDFIDYTCINCQRTFPYMNDWYSKYKDEGLEIVAIHTPEFSFEKDIKNVTMAADQFKLRFPIVLDNDYATWNAYQNQYWPHKYLIDIHGNVVYDHIGEGGYAETEAEIVKLLNDRKRFLGEQGSVKEGTTMPAYSIQTQSPETYFGAMRNDAFGNGRPGLVGTDEFTLPQSLTPNEFYLGGKWNIQGEYAENQAASTTLSFIFDASKMYLISTSVDGTPIEAQILIDGKPISQNVSGSDIKNGVLIIPASRLYNLFSSSKAEQHRIDIIFKTKGARVYTFTFG